MQPEGADTKGQPLHLGNGLLHLPAHELAPLPQGQMQVNHFWATFSEIINTIKLIDLLFKVNNDPLTSLYKDLCLNHLIHFEILLPNASFAATCFFLEVGLLPPSLFCSHFFCFFTSLLPPWCNSWSSRLAILLSSRLGGDPKDQILLRVRLLCPIPLHHLLPSLQLFAVVMLPVDDDVAATPWW